MKSASVGRYCPARSKSQITNPLALSWTVFASFSFAETPVNILTGSGYDPNTHTAELKVCPVRVEPL